MLFDDDGRPRMPSMSRNAQDARDLSQVKREALVKCVFLFVS